MTTQALESEFAEVDPHSSKYKTTVSALTETTESDGLVDTMDNLRAIDETEADTHIGQHPALMDMCTIDCATNKRIVPNGEPVEIDNECFHGYVMLMIRTPDADRKRDDPKIKMGETPSRISKYFKDKKRRFEFQFQIKLKRVPEGPTFLGCELEHPIKVGTITKGLVNILLAMVRRINPGFHYSWGPDEKNVSRADMESGNYEKTHLSFPLEASMDRIVISKPGETPPELGHELSESNESVKRRRKTGFGAVPWNLEDTYTMCLWSQYADWIKWKSMNVPGVSPFLMSRVTGKQPIYLCVYEIDNVTPADYRKNRPGHLRKNLMIFSRMEFSNSNHTTGGLADALIPGRSKRRTLTASEHSFGDTESLSSDLETRSRITVS